MTNTAGSDNNPVYERDRCLTCAYAKYFDGEWKCTADSRPIDVIFEPGLVWCEYFEKWEARDE